MAGEGFGHLTRGAVFGNARSPITVRRVTLNQPNEPHDHDFVEIQLVLAGKARHRTLHGSRRVGRGDGFVIRPGAWHGYDHCRSLEVLVCCFGPELLRRELAWVLDDAALGYLFWTGPMALHQPGIVPLRLPASALTQAEAHAEALREAPRPGDAAGTHAGRVGRLLMLMPELARGAPAAATSSARKPHPAVIEALHLFEQRLSEDWTLSGLARQVHLEPSYFARRFKAETGLPPLQCLARQRAERAASLLLRTDLSIGEIARAVGWPDPNYFARRFRRHFQLSASQYRQQFARRATRA